MVRGEFGLVGHWDGVLKSAAHIIRLLTIIVMGATQIDITRAYDTLI